MSDLAPFLTILPVLLLALASPGAGFVMISNIALARGSKAGVLCAAGMATVDVIYAALSLLGLGLLLQQVHSLDFALRLLGGLYLCNLGCSIWRATLKSGSAAPQSVTEPALYSRNAYRLGFMTSVTNPKVMVFYGSMFTAAFAGQPTVMAQILLPPLCGLTSFGWYGFVAISLSRPALRRRYERLRVILDRLAGSALIGFGAMLIVGAIVGSISRPPPLSL